MISRKVSGNPTKNLTVGAIIPQILLFVLPLIATSILQRLFNTADTITVGRWGGDTQEECKIALAAVGSCGSLINLIVGLFTGLSLGAGVCVSHSMGARKYDEIDRVVHTAIPISMICGVIATVIGILFARPLLIMMGTEESVLDEAVPYMIAYFCGIPAATVYNYCTAMLNAIGDTRHPMWFLTIGGVANVILNLIMVLVFRAGALGVGIATAVSTWISLFFFLYYMTKQAEICHLDFRRLRFDRQYVKKILLIGLPAGLQGTLFSLSNVTVQSAVNSLGNDMVAGNSAAANLETFIYVSQNAFYQAALTFVGQNRGARNFRRVRQSALHCTWISALVGIALSLLTAFFGRELLGLFAPGNTAVIDAGMIKIRCVVIPYCLCGLMEAGCGCMRGLGKSTTSMVTSLVGSCVVRIVWIYTVFAAVGSAEALFLCYPVSWLLTTAAHYLFFGFTLRKQEAECRNVEEREMRVSPEDVPAKN